MSTIYTVILSTNVSVNDKALIEQLMDNPKEYCRSIAERFICIEDIHPSEHCLIDSYTFIGAFIYLDLEDFRKRLYSLPWKYPGDIQAFVKSEHDDRYRSLNGPAQVEQENPLRYNPADGKEIETRFDDEPPEPISAEEYRNNDMGGAWLYDPWTGKQRTSNQVQKDMYGRTIVPFD